MRPNPLIWLAIFISLIAGGVSTSHAQQVEGVAVVVNDEPITTFDVRNRMRLFLYTSGIQPTQEILEQLQQQAIDSLVDETLQLQTAAEFELQISEEEVDAAVQDLAARNGVTLQDITEDMQANNVDISTLRRQLRAEISWQYLVSGRYRNLIRVSNDQIDVALERVLETAREPQVRMAEILLEIPVGTEEAQIQQLLNYIYAQLEQGANFQQLAQQFSSAPTASLGGDTGYQPVSQLSPQIQQVITQLEPGMLTQPIRVPSGYLILAMIDKTDGSVVEQLRLFQISLPQANITDRRRNQLSNRLENIDSCENVEAQVNDIEGVVVTDLNQISANALIDSIRQAISDIEPVNATSLIETGVGLQSFVLCERTYTGSGIPTPVEIEDQITNQQLSLLARRWLRDIRRNATIEIR